MAYETLKGVIRQYIKTNGNNEITGQILQNVLIEMVDNYPSLAGYATQQWVQNKGYITSAALSGYATQSWVGQNYLPLTGGTLTGGLTVSDPRSGGASALINSSGAFKSSGVNAVSSFNATFDYSGITFKQTPIGGSEVTKAAINAASGTITATGSVTAGSFVKSGGTSSQFLKADGSVDSNAYITSAALSGYATESWVTNQGYITSSALSGYLPLTGGNLTGSLSILNTMMLSASSLRWVDEGEWSELTFDMDGITVTAYGSGYVIASEFIVPNGTSSQFLKADGSVDSNAYITSAALSGYATQSWVGQNYLPLTGGTLTGGLTVSDPRSGGASALINLFGAFKSSGFNAVSSFNATFDYSGIIFKQTPMGGSEVTKAAINAASGTITATGSVTAGSFVKSGGTSSQFLKADGSVDSNAYITSAALSGYATETWVGNNYLSLSNGGEVDGLLVANDYIQTAKVYGFDNETLLIQGSDTDGIVQIDAASGIYLTTDGNSSWIFCEDICCMDSQNKWKIAMSGNAYFKNLYLYDLNISEGNAGYGTKYLCVKNGVLKFFDGTNEKTVLLQ